MESRRTSGRRSAGARKPPQRGFPYGSSQRPAPSRPARARPSVQLRAARGDRRPPKQRGGGLARLDAVGGQKPARSPFEKASARLGARRKGKQSAGRAAAVASVARGLVSQQRSARGSKKGPAALAMAAAGAVGGVALARRRKAGAVGEPEAVTDDTTLHVSTEPVEPAGAGAEGGTAPPPATG